MYWVKYVRFNGRRYKSCVRFFYRCSNAFVFADEISARGALESTNIDF